MVLWSSMFINEGSTTSSEDSSKHMAKHVTNLVDSLKCYVCGDFFCKPRILPCGHTYCSDCISSLRETAVQEFNKSRDRNAHRRGDGGYFTCPWPSCHYSMKIMNVSRWTLKNRAISHAVAMAKKQEREKQTAETQTTIKLSSSLFTIPKTLFTQSSDTPYLSTVATKPPPPSSTVVVQQLLQNALSTESLSVKHYRPPSTTQSHTWKSCAFLVGAAVLDQLGLSVLDQMFKVG